MTVTAKKTRINLPRAKIVRAIEQALPKGRAFDLQIRKTDLGGLKIVRVVPPAWKNLWPAERITKVREEIEKNLTREQNDAILRFSVLTPAEYKRVFGVPHKLAPKRKVGRKTVRSRER